MSNVLEQLTIIIPFRAESKERTENLQAVLRWIAAWGCTIIVLEADKQATLTPSLLQEWASQAQYVFIKDKSKVFHRTHYINVLLRKATTPLVGVWDSDIIVTKRAVEESCFTVLDHQHTIAYPYNGRFIMHAQESSSLFRSQRNLSVFCHEQHPCLGRPSCGGAFIVHRNSYLSIGGENEGFRGWGPEDAERLHRSQILGWKTYWTSLDPLHHLYHPQQNNRTQEDSLLFMREEFIRICSLRKDKLILSLDKNRTMHHT